MSLMRYMCTLSLVRILLSAVFLRSVLGLKGVYSTQACVMGEDTFVIQTYGFSFFTLLSVSINKTNKEKGSVFSFWLKHHL